MGLVERTGILVGQADIGARHRGRLCLRVRGGRTAIPGADRGTRVAAGAALSGPAIVRLERRASSTSTIPIDSSRRWLGRVRCWRRRWPRDWPTWCRSGSAVVLWLLLWVLYLSIVNVGQTWYSFGWESLLLEIGFPGNLSRQRPDRAAGAGDVARTVAAVPARVRRRPDQTPRRLVLAGSDLPVLPPRNPADAGAAELVFPSPAQAAASGGSRGQPLRATHRPVRPVRPTAGGRHRRARSSSSPSCGWWRPVTSPGSTG